MRASSKLFGSVALLALTVGIGGCASRQPDVLPATAKLQMSGNGQQVYTAPSDGTVYVYDRPGERLLWSGPVREGQIVGVNAGQDRIDLNGAPVVSRVDIPDRPIEIHFAASAEPRAASGVNRVHGATVTDGNTVTTPGVTVQPPPVVVTPSVTVSPATRPVSE